MFLLKLKFINLSIIKAFYILINNQVWIVAVLKCLLRICLLRPIRLRIRLQNGCGKMEDMNASFKDSCIRTKRLYSPIRRITPVLTHSRPHVYLSLPFSLSFFLSFSPFSFLRVCDTVMRYVIPSRPVVRRLRRCATQRDTHA